ncbi:hypothetical protein N7G274_009565 [Stereocaulon virgatum]|uniref:Uncharacterized protein n=1 Tax=Stereocaulon virgatum TaxID=373712 RepID=A0ABR3ZXY1_9LECA
MHGRSIQVKGDTSQPKARVALGSGVRAVQDTTARYHSKIPQQDTTARYHIPYDNMIHGPADRRIEDVDHSIITLRADLGIPETGSW